MTAFELPLGLTAEALAAAAAEDDPTSLAASTRLRRRFAPDLAAAAVTQVVLRRRARAKFGAAADALFLTADGLEQATRPEVAAHHAARLVASGVNRVVDLGCGIGADAMAFVTAGLEVVAVERDPAVAEVARANLGGRAEVVAADATEVVDGLLTPGTAVFCDPARRTASGRVWRVEDVSPPWSWVLDVVRRVPVAGVKLGPALPHAQVPDRVEAEWVSHRGDVVEVALWTGPAAAADGRAALLLASGGRLERSVHAPRAAPPVRPPGPFVYEPDGAAIRAGLIEQLAAHHDLALLDPHLAYLTGPAALTSPWLTGFAVLDVLPLDRRALRRWVADRDVGTLEIKLRGIDLDPAELRRALRPRGHDAVTLLLTRTPDGARALCCRRI